MKKIIAAGHICIDITPIFKDSEAKDIGSVLKPGKLIQTGKANVSTGGAVANTGLAMKKLGANVSLMGKVGRDEFGDMICEILKKYDAESGMIRSEEVSTSYSVVLAIPGIDRIFLHNPGANDTFCADDVKDESLEGASLFHFGYPTLMKSMYENDGEELVSLFKKVKNKGIATSLDLSAVDSDSEAGKVNWELILAKVIPYVDFFVPSVEELCFMLDRNTFNEWQKRANGQDITDVIDIEDIIPLANKCLELGAKVLLIKCGAKGMYLRTSDNRCLMSLNETISEIGSWGNLNIFEKSYIPEKVLSGTGAGDTSIAAFLISMLNGETPQMCLHLAAGTGASCVEAYDALSGLRSLDELKVKINAGWKKYN